MKKSIITLTIAGLALTACGGKTVYVVDSLPEVPGVEETDAPETTQAPKTTPAPTRPPASYDTSGASGEYDESAFFYAVETTAPTVYSLMSNSDILNMGLIVCETLDSGATISDVSQMMVTAMGNTGTYRFAEELAGVTAAALLYLCPEHSWWLETL